MSLPPILCLSFECLCPRLPLIRRLLFLNFLSLNFLDGGVIPQAGRKKKRMPKAKKGSAAADAAAEAKSVFDVRLRADERSGIMGKATQKEPGSCL